VEQRSQILSEAIRHSYFVIMSASALEAKNEGTAAWSAGNFSSAAEHFSKAIEIGGDKEFLKVLHSNRSAAYLKLNRITEALKDGNQCISLDPNYAKGYTRKGDALLASKQFTEAFNAYNAGLRVAPTDATLKEKSEQAMRAIRNAAEATSASANRSFGGNTNFSYVDPSLNHPYVKYAQIGIIALCFLYLIPFFPYSWRYIAQRYFNFRV
jgi:tetratricopeptide (TPR) repeat protein